MPASTSRIPGRFRPVVAIIPARGGSKRIKKKALKKFRASVSLLSKTVEQARSLRRKGWLQQILVSSENPRIRTIASGIGQDEISVLTRPARLATDGASTLSVLRHLIRTEDLCDATVVLLQVTSPLRNEEDITAALTRFSEGDVDAVVSVTEAHPPPEWMFRFRKGRLGRPVVKPGTRRKPAVVLNGAVYIARGSYLLRRSFTEGRCAFISMPPERSVDVDRPYDLDLARKFAK